MAINILVEPQNPPIAGDYTLDQAIQQACETPVGSILTLWEDTASIPAAQQTSFIRHAGNTFQVQGSNEAISGSLSAGINYIAATESAGVITLAWVTSTTGYAYNHAYGGIYNGSGLQLLRDICFVDGTDNIRGRCFGQDFNTYYLANGTQYVNASNAQTLDVVNANISGDLDMGAAILPGPIQAFSTANIAAGGYITLARGVWLISLANNIYSGFNETSASTVRYMTSCTIFSDGTERFYNNSSTYSMPIYYRKVG